MQRVLVTGANGLIGRVVMERLADRYDLVPLARDTSHFSHAMVADITDLDAIEPAFAGIDAVVHLAASPSVDTPWENILQNNLIGAYNVFEAAQRQGVAAVVFASSNHTIGGYELDGAPEIYGLDDPRCYDHQVDIRPDSLYGVSKVYGEALGRYYHDTYGMRVYNLRIGTVREDDDPLDPSVTTSSAWLDITPEAKFERLRATWLSQRDCAELIACCLEAKTVDWATVYGISDNPRQLWDLGEARRLLGFEPQDSAPG